jgi:protein-disulfide isomerase
MKLRNLLFTLAVALAVLVTGSIHPALAQSSEELKAIRKQIQELQAGQKAMQARIDKMEASAAEHGPGEGMVLSVQGAPFMGDKDAKVTVIEFFDFQCGFCGRHAAKTFPLLMNEYIKTGKLKYVVRDFPLDSHPQAPKAAEAARCAGDQGKYWPMYDRLFDNPKLLAEKDLPAHAQAIRLDTAKFGKCLSSGQYTSLVSKDQHSGELAGVDGTPTFFFGITEKNGATIKATKALHGAQPYPYFKDAIDSLLKQ